MSRYVELHARSAFSFLEGASVPEELIAVALELNMPAMALLDRDGVYGAPRLRNQCPKSKVQRAKSKVQSPRSKVDLFDPRFGEKSKGLSKSLPPDYFDETACTETRPPG